MILYSNNRFGNDSSKIWKIFKKKTNIGDQIKAICGTTMEWQKKEQIDKNKHALFI